MIVLALASSACVTARSRADAAFERADYVAAADSVDALEASYSASLLLPALVQLLDDTDGLAVGDGKATLVVQTIDGRFHPSLVVRGNAALSRSLPRSSKLVPPRAPAIHLAGATRILIPITVTRLADTVQLARPRIAGPLAPQPPSGGWAGSG